MGCLPVLVLGTGALWWGAARGLRGATPPATRTETVRRGDVSVTATETGTIEPLKKVEVKSKVAGRVARLAVDEGSRVRAGQLLVEIDPTEINSQVAQMRAQMDGARSRLRQAETGAAYQSAQTETAVAQAREALGAAQARLAQAREENAAQPVRTQSDRVQAEATLASARSNLALLKESTQPQSVVQAQTSFDEAQIAHDNARRSIERNQKLLDKGFVSEAALDAARAELAAATARRDQAKKRLDLLAAQSRLEVAEAQSRVQQASAALARVRADRSLQTRRQEVISAQSAVAQARAQLSSALSGVAQNAMRRDDVAQARSSVVQLENQLNEIAVRQNDTRLVAPMSGTVTRRYIEQGELVTSGVSSFSSGQPILQIADLSRMLVTMSINEVDVQRIRVGLPVEIGIDGVRGETFAGRVRKVAPAAGSSGQSSAASSGGGGGGRSGGVIRFAVEVLFNKADQRLRPGMSARCTIIIARRKNVLRLPAACVKGEKAKATVAVVTRRATNNGTAETTETRKIVAGLRSDSHVEIVSGLKENETVKPGAYTGPKRRAFEFGD